MLVAYLAYARIGQMDPLHSQADTFDDDAASPHSESNDAPFQVSSEHFRAIADYTYDWEDWQSPSGQLLWVNSAVERLTGFRPDECLAMPDYPLPLVAPRHRKRISRVIVSAIAGASGNNVEFQTQHRNGSLRWMAVSWQPMYDQAGQRLGFRSSVRDIADKRDLREQLRLHNEHLEQLVQERTARIMQLEEQRLKMERMAALGELAAGVAHEINNPLAGIRNAFSLFKSSLSPDAKYYDMLDLIDDEIERISKITHHMYQLYRPSTGHATRFNLERTIRDVVLLLDPLIKCSDVAVQVNTTDCCETNQLEATEVVLRQDELKQVLFNLVRNAIQASEAGTQVEVELKTTAKKATIVVSDQGCGIDAAVVPQLFSPFFTTKSELPKQGMGLGLSVSSGLVEAMGGKISVHSQVGLGSRFTVSLPRKV